MHLNVFISRPTRVLAQSLQNLCIRLKDKEIEPRTLGIDKDQAQRNPLDDAKELLAACQGAIILGFPRDPLVGRATDDVRLDATEIQRRTTEWNHLEAGLAAASAVPMLVIRDVNAVGGIFDAGAANVFVRQEHLSNHDWPMSDEFGYALDGFKQRMLGRKNGPERHLAERTRDEQRRLLTIQDPLESTFVRRQDVIRGTAPSRVKVWIVIHPHGWPKFYVQGVVDSERGTWECPVHIGADHDSGRIFEIRACIEPLEPLKQGLELDHWPQVTYSSFTRLVIRQ